MRTGDGRRAGDEGFTLVELLVAILLTSIIATAITSVILSTMRASTFTQDLRTVMDEGRISLDRMRTELRAARRILEDGSSDSSVRFWLDRDQDGQMQADELICWAVAEIGDTGTYELLRWTGATEDCDEPAAGARSIARTLVTPDDIFIFEPDPSNDPQDPRTRLVTIQLVLQVSDVRGPDAIQVETTVRLRNVR